MINKVFFDLDETLIHTNPYKEPDQECIQFELDDGIYYTIVRPNAKSVIEWVRNKVGYDNVYILTVATKDYAIEVNKLADFGFSDDHILARCDLERHRYTFGYDGVGILPHKELSNINNVLIDNMPAKYNTEKQDLIGITSDNYLNVPDYYGVNRVSLNNNFKRDVEKFILDKLEDNNK